MTAWRGPEILEAIIMTLEHEVGVYQSHLLELLGVNYVNEGKYTVIKGDEIAGPFESYEDALDFAYAHHGLSPFLIKKIARGESILYFSRNLL